MEWSLTGLPLPIVLRPLSPLTDDELIAFSRKNEPYRIEKNAKGELEIMTPVGYDGGRHEIFVARELDYWAEENGKGEASGPNTGFNLPDGSTLSPDASWISKAQLRKFTREQRKRFLPICPEFLVEVRSESDNLTTLQAKMEIWIANGAKLAWLIDPYARTITVYRPQVQPEVLEKPDSIEASEPVAGFRLTTSRLWA
jgi:Uma2 family endonuclease